jgi:hypothetical protein
MINSKLGISGSGSGSIGSLYGDYDKINPDVFESDISIFTLPCRK